MTDVRGNLGAVLRQLRELGVDELFLDRLTAEEARSLVGGAVDSPAGGAPSRPAARPGGRAPDWREVLGDGAGDEAASSAGAVTSGTLSVLQADAATCTRCRLAEGRTQVVFGRGAAGAELVVVGEAPGSEEDRTGLPFVGPAGKLLDLLLLSVGFDRESVYICNVLKCRPPNNRNPLPDEVEQCSDWLHGQLEAIRPKVLLAVGKFAGQTLTGTESPIGRLRGQVHSFRGIPVVATYHPAYLLRTPSATRKTWQDFQLMRQVLDESA